MRYTDVLIVGSGIAGLCTAIKLAKLCPDKSILIITKSKAENCNTYYAQGGVATVVDKINDSFEKHIQDTLLSGGGLCNEDVVSHVVKSAPSCIAELIDWGVEFDCVEHYFHLGLEGGHSASRILHHKDKTGAEIEVKLLRYATTFSNIEIGEYLQSIDLCMNETHTDCCGMNVLDIRFGKVYNILADQIILATGGCGYIFLNTTNPDVATGDGYAIAKKAGARLKDLRYIQIHPTAFAFGDTRKSKYLLSEALRGFGAHITDESGYRFLFQYDDRGELATRDIISSAIFDYMRLNSLSHVYLDLRHIDSQVLQQQFPNILQRLVQEGYRLQHDLIPIIPSVHYQCGGIVVDNSARTSIGNLYAVGEVASTGLHGANRLASNSLIEAVVFAFAAATDISNLHPSNTVSYPIHSYSVTDIEASQFKWTQLSALKLRTMMDDFLRYHENANDVTNLIKHIIQLYEQMLSEHAVTSSLIDLRNMAITAGLIIEDMHKHQKESLILHLDNINKNE